jgi:hypothetical protein
MRLILEKAEVLKLLGAALGYDIQDGDAEIVTDPFEVHIKNVRIAELATPAPKQVAPRVQAVAPPVPDAPISLGVDDEDADLTSELARSASLAAQLPSSKIDPDVRGINDFARPLRPGETEEPPGEDFSGEIPG